MLQTEYLCSLENSYAEILSSSVMVFGDGDISDWLGDDSEALLMGLMILSKRLQKYVLPLLSYENTAKSHPSMNKADWVAYN